ncbi:type VI secretion system tube protein TssD [Aequorivita capsosiphonis]|uniref:type VI secretion system tube protein TssD n=1 Tax=Aequorivita capsosiphonis TaxID=487317 RepID=UPI00041E46A7|nr:type VI secretion system tube protein TssD [Aequorivita capsosiphonis]
MSFLSTLILDGEELNLLDCSFTFTQGIDYTGRPSEKPRGGQMRLLIEGTAKTDFLEWMIQPNLTKKGTITFYRRDTMSGLKKIEFNGAHCIEYTESFNAVDNKPLKIFLLISAEEIKVKGTSFKNNWPNKI